MIPRLYIETDLATGAPAPLNDAQAHYLKNVLRRDAGDSLLLFNGRDGEFAAEITELKKKGGLAAVREKTSEQKNEPDLWLLFAPVKRGPLETIVQKSVELGVGEIAPIITERTNAPKVNRERLRAIAIEAAEQCGRMSVPNLANTAATRMEPLMRRLGRAFGGSSAISSSVGVCISMVLFRCVRDRLGAIRRQVDEVLAMGL